MWRYLKQLVKDEGTTILIVSHYPEEARNADTVGIMRSGKMLVEDAPEVLLKKYGSNLLDDVVMRLTVVLDYNGMSDTNIAKVDPNADKNLGVASTTGSEAGYANSNNSSDFSRVNDVSKNDPGLNNGKKSI
jgi:ABC-type multidrug transport system ATPase subunit